MDILYDGYTQITSAVTDLMNRAPRKVNEKGYDALIFKVQHMLDNLDWVDHAEVRLREEGQVCFAEAFIIPKIGTTNLLEKVAEAEKKRRRSAGECLIWLFHLPKKFSRCP